MNIFNAIIGPPGCGKSYTLNDRIDNNPNYAIVTSTTGISALNVGGCTINSLLQYFNTADLYQKLSLNDNYLYSKFNLIAKEYDNIALDEVSMMDGIAFTLIMQELIKYNSSHSKQLGLLCLGDPGQLPVVSKTNNTPAFFEVPAWDLFNVDYRTKIYRQENQQFAEALGHIRLGRVSECVDWFVDNVEFCNTIDEHFEGSTFYSTNDKVDGYNYLKLKQLKGKEVQYATIKQGKQNSDWKAIPLSINLKEDALVVLLHNNKNQGYVNGDLAKVKQCSPQFVVVELLRNKQEKVITYATKTNKFGGSVSYLPMRLGWALTVHRVQGLTIDSAQIFLKENFLRRLSGGLAVALSRVRTPQGLRLIGNKDDFVKACFVEPKYINFILQLEKACHRE